MIDKLLEVLTKFCGGQVYEQGTLAPDKDYPAESFITYSIAGSECVYLNNNEALTRWSGSVQFYSSDYSLIPAQPFEIRRELKAAGFIVSGKGFPLISPRPDWSGWAFDFDYMEA